MVDGVESGRKIKEAKTRQLDAFCLKIPCFRIPTLVWRPLAEECPAMSK